MSEIAAAPAPPHTAGVERRRRRISAIWIIPIVAVGIAAWLAWDTLSKEGPTISISFEGAEGLQEGQSLLKYKDLTLGTVKSLSLTADHMRVIATVATTKEAEPLLSDQTVFWVVKPRLFAGTLSGLGTLISGSYIGMLPGKEAGKSKHAFVGLEDPPVLQSNVPGTTFLVKADRLGSINVGSPVFFRDLQAGEVLGWDLGDMASSATIHVFVRAPFDHYVHDATRFWNASGLSIKLGGSGIDVQVASLRAILLGGIAFDATTGNDSSAADHVFPLYASQDAATAASYGRRIKFIAYFPGSVRGLSVGADVTLHGLKIGQVTSVALTFDREKDAIVAPVGFEVEPERFTGIGQRAYANPADGVNELVSRGMRATLQSASLITGQMLVAMEVLPDAPAAKVMMQGDDVRGADLRGRRVLRPLRRGRRAALQGEPDAVRPHRRNTRGDAPGHRQCGERGAAAAGPVLAHGGADIRAGNAAPGRQRHDACHAQAARHRHESGQDDDGCEQARAVARQRLWRQHQVQS